MTDEQGSSVHERAKVEPVAIGALNDAAYEMASEVCNQTPTLVRGVGIDAVDIDRCRTIVQRSPDILQRVCGPGEIAPRTFHEFARRWAVKEAVIKAVGGGLMPQHVTVLHDVQGRPEIDEPGGRHIDVSVTDTDGVAIAIAVWHQEKVG